MPEFVFEGEPTYDVNGYYTGPLPAPSAIPTQSRLLAPKLPDAWPARMCEWLAQLALATWAPPAATEPAAKGEIAQQPARESPLASPSRTDPSATTTSPTSRRAPGYRVAAGGPGYATKWMDLAADDPDRDFLRRAEEGLPLGILEGLPRTPHVFEEQTSWRLDKDCWEPALAWVPNCASIEDHKDFVRAKFEEDVQEDLMEKMTLLEFKARFGENRAIASLAVIVEDEEKDKKRIIHDATHGVRVNHRIRCRDKIRAPGAREKKQILRELQANKEIAYSVVGDISKAYKHQASEHGFMGCQIDGEETVDGDPDSQIVYVNKVGTFGLSPASYWWTRIAACGIRATHHLLGPGYPMDMLLHADDLEALGIDDLINKYGEKPTNSFENVKFSAQLNMLPFFADRLFVQMGRVFKQQRGSAIRHQISPSLANVAVSFKEQWFERHQDGLQLLQDEVYMFATLTIVCCYALAVEHPVDGFFQEFLAPFSKHPVELEDVLDGEFLGTTLNPVTRTLDYRQSTTRHQFRPFCTAGTEAHKLSAAFARIRLASRNSFPFEQAEADVQTLIRSYSFYRYDESTLQPAASTDVVAIDDIIIVLAVVIDALNMIFKNQQLEVWMFPAATDLQLDLLGLWANVNARGNSNVAHIHPGLLSGILYLQAGTDQGATLCFTDPRSAAAGEEGPLDGVSSTNDCNTLEASTGLVGLQGLRAGELLVFPSWLQHHVPPHVGTEPRISLSFNLQARIVGEKSDLQFRSSEGDLPPRIAGLDFMRMVHLFPNNLSQHVEEQSCSNLPARQAHTEGPRRERPPAEVASWMRSSRLAARWICARRAAAPTSRPPLADAHGSVSLLTLPSGFVQAARTRRLVLSPTTAVTGIHVLQGRLVLWLFDPSHDIVGASHQSQAPWSPNHRVVVLGCRLKLWQLPILWLAGYSVRRWRLICARVLWPPFRLSCSHLWRLRRPPLPCRLSWSDPQQSRFAEPDLKYAIYRCRVRNWFRRRPVGADLMGFEKLLCMLRQFQANIG
eukprot:s5626_g1.t2